MTPAAHTAILSVLPRGSALPIVTAPNPDLIASYIPAAIERVRTLRTITFERDQAVIAILQVYGKLYGKRPPSPKGPRSKTPLFIARIEREYRDLLPIGFGVSRSKATLDRLIKLASAHPSP